MFNLAKSSETIYPAVSAGTFALFALRSQFGPHIDRPSHKTISVEPSLVGYPCGHLQNTSGAIKQFFQPGPWDPTAPGIWQRSAKSLEPPSTLEEAQIRDHPSTINGKFKEVKKALGKPRGGGRACGGGRGGPRAEGSKRASRVMVVSETLAVGSWFAPGE